MSMRRSSGPLEETLPLFDRVERPVRWVVPTERHVERLARDGIYAETRAALRARLLAALSPGVSVADPDEARLALASALGRLAHREERLAPFVRAGGGAWARTVVAFDAAIGVLEAAGTPPRALEHVAREGGLDAWKSRVLGQGRAAVEAALARVGRVDPRRVPLLLADAIGKAEPRTLVRLLGADRLQARWILAWDAADVSWWRELDAKLTRLGGSARICIPTVDRSLDAARDRDSFDVLADELARQLQEAPELELVSNAWAEPRFGVAPPTALLESVEVCVAADARAQADAATHAIVAALRDGVAPERTAILACSTSDEVLRPIYRALRAAGVPTEESRGTLSREGLLGLVWAALEEGLTPEAMTRAQHARNGRSLLADIAVSPKLGAGARAALAAETERGTSATDDHLLTAAPPRSSQGTRGAAATGAPSESRWRCTSTTRRDAISASERAPSSRARSTKDAQGADLGATRARSATNASDKIGRARGVHGGAPSFASTTTRQSRSCIASSPARATRTAATREAGGGRIDSETIA